MGNWDKFKLLMWKNWKLQLRRPVSFVFQVGLPLLVVVGLLIARNETPSGRSTPPFIYPPSHILDVHDESVQAYSPNDNKLINEIMSSFPYAVPFPNQTALEEYLKNKTDADGNVFGIQFDQHLPQEISEITNMNITLRFSSLRNQWETASLFPPLTVGFIVGRDQRYSYTFVPAMYTMTNLLIRKSGRTARLPDMYLQRFPDPPYFSDPFFGLMTIPLTLGFLLMTAFAHTFITIVNAITYEKEKQLKESMKIMGLPTWLHWTAWYCKSLSICFFIVLGIVIMMKWETNHGQILLHTDTMLLIFFLFLFVSAMITFAFALSVFFSRANRASSVSGLLWVVSFVPCLIVLNGSTTVQIYLSALSVTSAMSYGFYIIQAYEVIGQGIDWSNLFETSEGINFSFGGILIMLVFDIIIYLLIALYVEAIFPGEFGVPQKWYFCLKPEFWSKKKFQSEDFLLSQNNSEFFEDDPTDLNEGIKIINLGKRFGANEAVKGISLNMYENQITVLLGHNGAGKTTTMSMLAGMFPPTKGTAFINGYDIRTQIMSVRDSMGLCPQHNVLFDELTVREHLIFFSRLKGCTGPAVEHEVDKFLTLLSLHDKADAKTTTLSGGMKRKLCVGIALCGNSKVIMLDEPTAGMDPSARRFIWEFLQTQKKGKTILLTTHFMDEADLLGDRIAIMSSGELQCCGSSFFLKKKYGTGYHLIIDQLPHCNPQNITNILRRYISSIEVESNAGTELTYLLPETHVSMFTDLLAELENNLQELGIRSFGISLTNLEEVFMKVGTSETGRTRAKETRTYTPNGNTNIQIGLRSVNGAIEEFLNQLLAMTGKKLISAKRTWGMELMKIVMPVLFILLIVKLGQTAAKGTVYDRRDFSLSQYDHPITLVEENGNLQEPYIHMLQDMNQKIEVTDNMTKRIINLMKDNPYDNRYKYIVGASFQDNKAFAWYSGEPYHSVPLSFQLLLQQSYKSIVGENFNINFINYPMPQNFSANDVKELNLVISSINIVSVSLAATYIGAFYILFVIKERMSQAKHLQFVSGMNVVTFHLTAFLCDLLTFALPCIAIIITFAILGLGGLSTSYELSVIAFTFFSFGVSLMPWLYLLSALFTVPSTGYSTMFFVGFVTGFPCVGIIEGVKAIQWKYATLLNWIMRFYPHFNLASVTTFLVINQVCPNQMEMCLQYANRTMCEKASCEMGCCSKLFDFTTNGRGYEILMFYVIAFVSFICLILRDTKILNNHLYSLLPRVTRPPEAPLYVDSDVKQENDFVTSNSLENMRSQNVLLLRHLTKHFCRLTAVNGLNLTVKKSECFGLLGVNGAGKTTTFKMMTGDETISFGDAFINGYGIRTQLRKVYKFIGYCPQFDALLDNLTTRETLEMFSLIRGVPRDECSYVAESLARDFDFTEHLDKEVAKLSGGNKRKLSTAIALIGDSPIIFLDEPTTGMDPATKRLLWNNLTRMREDGKSIILTSHSMEECEALCTRLAIMVNGNFQCLGSVQHLKNKFAEGFSITLKIRKPDNSQSLEHSDTTDIENFMTQNFPTCKLQDKHQELMTYYVKDERLSWSKLFGILERSKDVLNIEDYSVGQASLEQVFLSFTKQQNAEVKFKTGCGLWCC